MSKLPYTRHDGGSDGGIFLALALAFAFASALLTSGAPARLPLPLLDVDRPLAASVPTVSPEWRTGQATVYLTVGALGHCAGCCDRCGLSRRDWPLLLCLLGFRRACGTK